MKQAQLLFYEKNGHYTENPDLLIHLLKEYQADICNDDSLKYIPFSNGKPFEIETGILTTNTGETVDDFEIKASFTAYLKGTNKEEVEKLQIKALQSGVYPGMKISSGN